MTTYIKPAAGPISSKFGPRPSPGGIGSSTHLGTDIGCWEGTAVVASAAGKVTFSGLRGGWGYLVIIDHGNGHETWYAHLSYFAVRVRQWVEQGQVIAASGGRRGHPGAGTSTGPHLHTEHRINGTPVDPEPYWITVASADGITTITIEEEEHEMALKDACFCTTANDKPISATNPADLYVIVNTTSGYFSPVEGADGGYATSMVRAHDIAGPVAWISKSHYRRIEADCAAVRQGK